MTNEIDHHVGRRLRRRRRLMGYTQQSLAESVGVRFQQIQNMSAERTVLAPLVFLSLLKR